MLEINLRNFDEINLCKKSIYQINFELCSNLKAKINFSKKHRFSWSVMLSTGLEKFAKITLLKENSPKIFYNIEICIKDLETS